MGASTGHRRRYISPPWGLTQHRGQTTQPPKASRASARIAVCPKTQNHVPCLLEDDTAWGEPSTLLASRRWAGHSAGFVTGAPAATIDCYRTWGIDAGTFGILAFIS